MGYVRLMGISISRVLFSVAFNDMARLTVVSRPKSKSFGTRPDVETVILRPENPSPMSLLVIMLIALTTLEKLAEAHPFPSSQYW